MKKISRLSESQLINLIKKTIKEDEEQQNVISQVENDPTASDAAESVESLSREEQEYLANFIQSNPDEFKELVQNELESQQSNELTEDDDEEEQIPTKKSFEDEYGMSRKEFDIRKLIHKIVGYTAVAAGLATLPAAALISGGVAAGLGATALAGYLLKDASFYQKNDRTQYGSGIQKGGINYKASDLADYEDSMTESYKRKKVVRLTESDLTRIVKRVIKEDKSRRELNLQKKLDSIFFGKDEMNLFSEPNEYGYLSSEHRLSKNISPKQRMERMQQVIDELENYIKDLKFNMRSEESFTENPEYENIWKDVENNF